MRIKSVAFILLLCLILSSCGTNTDDGTTEISASELYSEEFSETETEAEIEEISSEALSEEKDTVATVSYGLVPESAPVDKSYFDDAAFVGDSVSLKLSYYQAATKSLGDARFFAAGSLSAANALWSVSDKSVHPSFGGTKMLVEDCIQKSGAKKVYIMLGMNDIGIYGFDTSIENYKTLIARIKAKSPEVTIFIQSITPMTETSTRADDKLNNTNIRKYNEMLLKMCETMDWYFVDVGSAMYDDEGECLRRSFCSDSSGMGVHFTNEGCSRWVDYLLTHTVDFS